MKKQFVQLFKIILVSFFIVFTSNSSFSQSLNQPKKNEFWTNVRFGGGIGLSIGDDFYSATLAPTALYEFNRQFALGVGINGTINSQKNTYKSTIIGGSIIGTFNPLQEIQLSSEFEQLHVSRNYNNSLNLKNDSYWYPALFLGAGYRNRNFIVGLRYDVLYNSTKSIYADSWAPFIRVYF